MRAIFDVSPALIGTDVHGMTVQPIDEVAEWLSNHHADIAVLAVPAVNAQKIADMLTDAGIHSIWNFAPVDLVVPDNVALESVHLSDSLHALSFKIKSMSEKENGDQ
jgi:redox-sensing transcriptional repressor